MNATVSIIIPCHNSGKYIEETLESVFAQTFQAWECIVVDNASTDNTEEIVKRHAATKPQLQYYRLAEKGVSKARNYAVSKSRGTYILPLDSDDKIAATYIEKAMQVLENDPGVKLVYADATLFDAVKKDWTLPEYSYSDLLIENSIYCSALFRRSDFLATKGYNENMVEGFEDWDFWIGFLDERSGVHKIAEQLFFYRIRRDSRNNTLDEAKQRRLRKQIYENHRAVYEKHFSNSDFIFDFFTLRNELNAIKQSKAYGIGTSVTRLKNLFGK
jgi:glycosyltransferase involved in cell wall biosynthesis